MARSVLIVTLCASARRSAQSEFNIRIFQEEVARHKYRGVHGFSWQVLRIAWKWGIDEGHRDARSDCIIKPPVAMAASCSTTLLQLFCRADLVAAFLGIDVGVTITMFS